MSNKWDYIGISGKSPLLESFSSGIVPTVLPLRSSLALSTCKSPRFPTMFGNSGNMGYFQKIASAFPQREMPTFIAKSISDKARDIIGIYSDKCAGDMEHLHACESNKDAIQLMGDIAGNINGIIGHPVYSKSVNPLHIKQLLAATANPRMSKETMLSSVMPFIESVYSIFPTNVDKHDLCFMSALAEAVEQ